MRNRNSNDTVLLRKPAVTKLRVARFFFSMSIILALFCFSVKLHAEHENLFSNTLDIDEVLTGAPTGTPAREENECKLTASASLEILQKNSYILGKIRTALEKAFANDLLWKAPTLTRSDYYIMEIGLGTFCFLDIYLDTDDQLNFREDISYRVRYRWHSRAALFRYLLGSRNPVDFPHRCEYQLKVYEKAWKDGFNNCLETRFEFRNASFPFKTKQSAPPAPWPFAEFIKPAITGKYENYPISTSYDYAKALKAKTGLSGKIKLKPSLIVVTTRRRIHLGIKNEFGPRAAELGMGSTTNADNAILITLDTSEIYGHDFLDTYLYTNIALSRNSLTPRLQKRFKTVLKPVQTFTELEFEFERNIESAISYEYEKAEADAEKNRLAAMKAAFIADLKTTATLVANTVNSIGINTQPGKISKYKQAIQSLKGNLSR